MKIIELYELNVCNELTFNAVLGGNDQKKKVKATGHMFHSVTSEWIQLIPMQAQPI